MCLAAREVEACVQAVGGKLIEYFKYLRVDRVVHTDLLLLFLGRKYWGRRVVQPRMIQS